MSAHVSACVFFGVSARGTVGLKRQISLFDYFSFSGFSSPPPAAQSRIHLEARSICCCLVSTLRSPINQLRKPAADLILTYFLEFFEIQTSKVIRKQILGFRDDQDKKTVKFIR